MRKAIGFNVVLSLMMGIAAPASAAVVLHGTRVVYPAEARDVTVTAENNSSTPLLVQAWLDAGDTAALPNESPAPFLLNPPLFRLEAKQTQSLRLIYTQDPIPADRESLYWFNVLEVPPETAQDSAEPVNKLRLIMRTRVKVFLRPKGLAGKASESPSKVQWSLGVDGQGKTVLNAVNPSAYHVTFSALSLTIAGNKYDVSEAGMVDPGQSKAFPLPNARRIPATSATVDYTYIDDYGANRSSQSSFRIGG